MPTNHSYGMGCSSCSGCMAFGTIRPIALSPLSSISLSGDLPLVSLGPVRVLDARLSTRGIPRLARSRARPLLALWVQGSRGTASERITTISLDSTCSQLFCNGTGALGTWQLQEYPDNVGPVNNGAPLEANHKVPGCMWVST